MFYLSCRIFGVGVESSLNINKYNGLSSSMKYFTSLALLLITLFGANAQGFNLEGYEIKSSAESKCSQPKQEKATGLKSGYGEISTITGRPKTVYVKGYYRKDGTYVQPYYRSPPSGKVK